MQSHKIFIAADVLVALVDRAHPKHLHASAFFRYFAQEQYFLYTNIVCIENAVEGIKKHISPILAKEFSKALSVSSVNILQAEDSDVKLTFKTLSASASSDISFEQALMSAMASRREIPFICTLEYLHPLFGLTSFYLPI